MEPKKDNIIYSVNTYTIANRIYIPIASEYCDGDSINNYNSDIRHFLSTFFFKKGVYLDEEQAIKKYGERVLRLQHPEVFIYDTEQGEKVYIEPFQKEKVFVVRREETEFFSFFFALTLKLFFEDKRIEHFQKFLNYQLINNFNSDIEDYNNFLDDILTHFSLSIFVEMHEFIKKSIIVFINKKKNEKNIGEIDNRIKGKLNKEEIRKYFMQLSDYPTQKGERIIILTVVQIKDFLHANFTGFEPRCELIKLDTPNLSQSQLRRFVYAFYLKHSNRARTDEYVNLLLNNFHAFDKTTFESEKSNFCK